MFPGQFLILKILPLGKVDTNRSYYIITCVFFFLYRHKCYQILVCSFISPDSSEAKSLLLSFSILSTHL